MRTGSRQDRLNRLGARLRARIRRIWKEQLLALAAVIRRRREYLQAPSTGGAWGFIWHRDRELTREAWPWLRSRRLPGRSGTLAVGIDRPGEGLPTWGTWSLQQPPIVHSAPLR